MNKKLSFSLLAALAMSVQMHSQVNIRLDVSQAGVPVSPTHYGIFFEDINHAADGGLYAELIQNRSFEDDDTQPAHWLAVGEATMALASDNLMNAAQRHNLTVNLKAAGDGVLNMGYWGINAVAGRRYTLSFWARTPKKYEGTLTARLQTVNGQSLGEVKMDVKLGKQWQKVTAEFTATANDEHAVFCLTGSAPGTISLDVVSLFPPTYKNRPNGCRPDLAMMLEAMHPRFMRFPGGCFVEGIETPENAFRWERTVGPIEQRPGHWNKNWGYRTTDGLGFHEMLQLAEDLGAKPLYVVNVGIWHGGYTPLDSIQPWIDECLGALEYANGDTTTHYGRLRAQNGHPEPFNIHYLEIGNENYNFHMDNNRDQSIEYPERYKLFYDAIKARYPQMVCIGNVESWGTDHPTWRNSHPVDMLDEHYYRNPMWFASNFHKYDTYDRRGPKIYTGEYAVTSQFGEIGNMNAALGEAVFMMGMENNSDVVAMNSYAPIFVNENNPAWRPDMIRFNSAHVMGTPSYYVQMLFPNNVGTHTVPVSWTENLPAPAPVVAKPVSVGMSSWNTCATYRNPQLIVDGKQVELPSLDRWELPRGWKLNGDEVTSDERGEGRIMACPVKNLSRHYTYKVQARKNGGVEGFLAVVDYVDPKNYNWFNVGGWGNTNNDIEQGQGGGRLQLSRGQRFEVENGRWYDLQVDVCGDTITTYIDGQRSLQGVLRNSMMRGVYCSATQDNGCVYLKVVNTGGDQTTAYVSLAGIKARGASLTRLSAPDGNDENTLQVPTNIYPVQAPVTLAGNRLEFMLPGYSVNIIRIEK